VCARAAVAAVAALLALAGGLAVGVVAGSTPAAAAGDRVPAHRAQNAVFTDDAYGVIDAGGGVATYGGAGYAGDALGLSLSAPIVGAAAAPGGGYWLAAADGGVFAFGDARFLGSMGGTPLDRPIVGIAATADGDGYWLVASDGGVFAFGDARYFGSMGGRPLDRPVIGLAVTPDGGGYWMAAADGGIFGFGDAHFAGSMGGQPLNGTVVGIAAAPTGGYWFVGSDGSVFSFGGAPFFGSLGGSLLPSPIASLASTPDGGGYWMADSEGSVYAFGDAQYVGGYVSPMHPPLYPPFLSAPVPPVTAIVALASGPQLVHTGAPRVLFLGDSVSYEEGVYTAADLTSQGSQAFDVFIGGIPGCGATDGAQLEEWSTPGQEELAAPACSAWASQYQWAVARYHPDSVVLQLGYWESQNEWFDGAFRNVSDPAYASYIAGDLSQAVGIAHADGAAVVLATAPYYGDGTPNWSVDVFNAMVANLASLCPTYVSVLDVGRMLDPGGTYDPAVDGITARMADGVHLTYPGVTNVLDPALVPLVTTLAGAVYAGSN